MEENTNENLNSQNEERQEETQDNVEQEDSNLTPEEILEKNRQLYARTKKAEDSVKAERGAREKLEKELEKLKKPKESKAKTDSSSNNVDADRLARLELKAEGIKHEDDQNMVIEEAQRLQMEVPEVLQMEYMKERLKNNQETREAQDGMPKGGNRSGAIGKESVEYYLAHPDERPADQELAEKVLDAKRAQAAKRNKFADDHYV